MGMLRIDLSGSFPNRGVFTTTAEEGGHVLAIKRGIEFLAKQLGPCVILDSELTKEGENPPLSPLGVDRK